ncbi:MAG: hypothetical protein AB7F11_12690 [Hydrogenophaga sp.]
MLAAKERGGARLRLEQQIHERLRGDTTGEAPPSEAEVARGLRRVEQALRTSPLHVGFTCKGTFFDGPAAFFSTGTYMNRTGNYGGSVEPGRAPPIYAALNVSLRGHKGWGNSCLVLKPELLDHALLSSCDTGDPYSRYLAQECTAQHPLSIVEDWLNDSFFLSYWKALAGSTRVPIPWRDVDMERPVEARLSIPDGRLRASDLAMICVDDRELIESAKREGADLAKRRDALRRLEGETGVSVVLGPKSGEPFPDQVSGYSAIVEAYAARVAGFQTAAAAGVESASPHYTEVSAKQPRIRKDWAPQPCL